MGKLPNKEKARQAIHKRIRTGEIKRQPCEVCGEIKAEAHHPDYRKPLEVNWLCTKHHREWHKKNGFQEGAKKKYGALFITPELHQRIKMLALKKKLTMIEYLDLLTKHKTILEE